MMRTSSFAAVLVGLTAAATLACSDSSDPSSAARHRSGHQRHDAPTLTPQSSGTTQRLQAISPVNNRVAWASGTGGTFTVTTDGGATWHAGVVPGASDCSSATCKA